MRLITTGVLLFLCISLCNAQQNNTDTLKFGDIIYTKVDVYPQFDGGVEAYKKYLLKNFKIEKVIKKMSRRDSAYKETAIVRFVVKMDGTLANIEVENEVPIVLKEEAIRLIATSPNWIPGMLNGEKVNAYRRLPISLIISPK